MMEQILHIISDNEIDGLDTSLDSYESCLVKEKGDCKRAMRKKANHWKHSIWVPLPPSSDYHSGLCV